MKISGEQRNAASAYWTQILTGEVNPRALVASKRGLPSFMAVVEHIGKKDALEKLDAENPCWPATFMMALDRLLEDADESLILKLEYQPEGILKEAADEARLPSGIFPSGRLTMAFDDKGNIIVGEELINADSFLSEQVARMSISPK